jgi:competence protein ComEC
MRLGAIAFLAGILSLHALAKLPNPWWGLGLPALLLIVLLIPPLRLFAWFSAGLLWALIWVGGQSRLPLPQELESIDLRAEGWVATIPESFYRGKRFQLQVDVLSHKGIRVPFAGSLSLSWYNNPPPIQVGDKWGLTVRLRRPHGLANPGSFDYERWLLAKGITAQGYVREHPEPELQERAARYPIDRFRQSLVERFPLLLQGSSYTGMLTALAVGDSQGIQPWQWEVFNLTGTSHLLSISGLHVGLIAGLVFIITRKVWGWMPLLLLRWPSTKAAALAAIGGAGGYSLLAGLSLPTQRSLVMITVAMLALLWQRPVVPSRILALALLVILVIDPVAPLTAGFWLSFGAVATILYYAFHDQGDAREALRSWLGLQLAVTLALLPATLVIFQQIPLLSPLANLIAIPWANLTVVPLTLLAVLAGFISESAQLGLLQLAVLAMDWLWQFLVWLARSPWAVAYHPAPPMWTLIFTLPGLLLLLAPSGTPGRWLGSLLCLPLVFFPRAVPAPGAVWFTLLDVGGGLSAVILTAEHALVYDTGPRWGTNFDIGHAVLVPFLRQQGVVKLDTLVISHADKAHTGGTRSLLERIKVDAILTASPYEVPVERARSCRAGTEWMWDEVRFRILHPAEEDRFSGNNASCVLLVESRHGRVLLTGDIESSAQAALVSRQGTGLRAEVLVVPQHGAGNLPLADFIAAVQPRYALFSTGYKNRFGFPKAETVQRYREIGAKVLDTATEGAITFKLGGHAEELVIEKYRRQSRHYWQADNGIGNRGNLD